MRRAILSSSTRAVLPGLVLVVLALHAGVSLGLAWLAHDGTELVAGRPRLATSIEARFIEPAQQPPEPPAAPTVGATATLADAASVTVAAAAAAVPRHYHSISEVDTPAVPQPDWSVDMDMLVGRGINVVTFEVFISETGRIERCKVIRLEPPARSLERALAARLCTTPTTPAFRGGVAVPSVRHIELVLSQ